MRLLLCGDVVGASGRRAVTGNLPRLRRDLELDFVVVNGENAAHGFGITAQICDELFDAGADVITTGNHVWDRREIIGHFDREPRLLRPHNFPAGTPGAGARVFDAPGGRKVFVLHLMARLFMDPLDDPFALAEAALESHRLGETVDATILDFHGEATSEKTAMGHFADGRASLVVGTHSHVPTADARILAGGTAFQTDAGMCGDYDSVIGMRTHEAVERFVTKMPTGRLEPADGEATLCAVYCEIDDRTGLAVRVAPVRTGGHLTPHWPG
jgi:2',3'-cyclic-nucleotide 2'-phosphodiesterase